MSDGVAGAPRGNRNAAKGKEWTDALRKVLGRIGEGDVNAGLEKIAMRVVKQASDGNVAAWKEIGERVEGKATQPVEHSGEFIVNIPQPDANL